MSAKASLLASVVFGTALFAGGVRAEEKASPPLVVVSGEAVLRAAPDRAFVTLSVESSDKDPKAAQLRNATVMNAVQEKLRAAGIAKEAVRTLSYDLQLEYDFDKGKRTPRGYTARNTVEIRLDDVARVGEIIDLSVGAGANAVTGVRFDLKDRASLERDALRQAVAEAKLRAEAAAGGAGVTIESIERIEESGGTPPAPRPVAMAMRVAAPEGAAPETAISAGELEVRAQVQLSARIKSP
jgi:uncharacterized protein YggE